MYIRLGIYGEKQTLTNKQEQENHCFIDTLFSSITVELKL